MQWKNRRGHLSLLRAAILAPPQVFTFASSPSKQAPLEGVDPAAATPNGAWLSLDLVASLLSLASDTELYAQVRFVGFCCVGLGLGGDCTYVTACTQSCVYCDVLACSFFRPGLFCFRCLYVLGSCRLGDISKDFV